MQGLLICSEAIARATAPVWGEFLYVCNVYNLQVRMFLYIYFCVFISASVHASEHACIRICAHTYVATYTLHKYKHTHMHTQITYIVVFTWDNIRSKH